LNKGFRWVLIAIAIIFVIVIILTGFLLLSSDKILSNVYINGISVSGLTKNEALLKLKESYGEVLQNSYLTLIFEDVKWKLDYSDIDYSYDFDAAINTAYEIGRTGNIVNRYFSSIKSKFFVNELVLSFSYNENSVLQKINDIAKDINRVPIDATIRLKSGKFVITPETVGLKLNSDTAFDLIKSRIEDSDISVVELPMEKIPPDIKKSDLENITEKLGEYTTKFDASNKNRTYNCRC
jgi:vancomycin resistance protein YoaR